MNALTHFFIYIGNHNTRKTQGFLFSDGQKFRLLYHSTNVPHIYVSYCQAIILPNCFSFQQVDCVIISHKCKSFTSRELIVFNMYAKVYGTKDTVYTAQKMKFCIKGFSSKFDQIRGRLQIWSHLLKKSLMENFVFCVVVCAFRKYLLQNIFLS